MFPTMTFQRIDTGDNAVVYKPEKPELSLCLLRSKIQIVGDEIEILDGKTKTTVKGLGENNELVASIMKFANNLE